MVTTKKNTMADPFRWDMSRDTARQITEEDQVQYAKPAGCRRLLLIQCNWWHEVPGSK